MADEINILDLPRDLEIIESQHARWLKNTQGHEEWATLAKKCTEFLEGNQWTELERQILREEGRPCITTNKIAPLVRLLAGFFRQNKYDIKYLPGTDGSGAQAAADALTACAKQTSEVNQSEWNDAQVFQDGITCARGYWDIRLGFKNNMLGEIVETVLDPFSVYIDSEADEYDPAGWNDVTVNRWMSISDILLLYGNLATKVVSSMGGFPVSDGYGLDDNPQHVAPTRNFGLDQLIDTNYRGINYTYDVFHHVNRHRKLLRVLDCQHKQLKRVRTFVDLTTGEEKVIPDNFGDAQIRRVIEYATYREVPLDVRYDIKKAIRWTTTVCDRILYDEWSIYDNYTVVPYFPYFRRGKTRGVIEDLIDPQTELNKRKSARLHIIMATANSGWMYKKGSLSEEMKEALEYDGARPGIHIEYEGDAPPQRIDPSASPQGFDKIIAEDDEDLKEISGINDSALGQNDNANSGRAIQSRQKQTVIGSETYFDNFSRSRQIKGRHQLNIYQNFYTEERLILTRTGNKTSEIYINAKEGADAIKNDITVGSFMVAIDETPISSTFMQGQFQEALDLREMGVPVPDDILIELSSMPNKEEIKTRMEQDRQLAMNQAKIDNLMQRGQMGIPPDVPLPPVVTTPEVTVMPPETPPGGQLPLPLPPIGGAPLPPGAAPMPPQLPPPPPKAPPNRSRQRIQRGTVPEAARA